VAGQAALSQGGGQHGAYDDNGRDGVGDGHERRVQRRRDVPDDMKADVDGQHENNDVDQGWTYGFHQALLSTLPSLQTMQATMISSSSWMASSPSLLAISFMKSSTLRAYRADASCATRAGRLL